MNFIKNLFIIIQECIANERINKCEVKKLLKEKLEILEHQQKFIRFTQKLEILDEHILRKPIDKGKWSVIEIIGHFYAWDEFVLQYRIPYLFKSEHLQKGPNTKDLNTQSALLARSEDIEITLKKCIRIRNELFSQLSQISDDNWLIELQINQSKLTLYEYLKGLREHDVHHIKQIKSALKLDVY